MRYWFKYSDFLPRSIFKHEYPRITSLVRLGRTKGLSRGQKAIMGTAIPVCVIAFLVLALFHLQWTRKRRAKEILRQTIQEEKTEDNIPLSKPELQGEDSRHEMLTEDLRFELDAGNARYEMMTKEQGRTLNSQVQQHELRGEEFCS